MKSARLSVLVAGENAAANASLEHLLTAAGHTVAIVPEAAAALQRIHEQPFDFVFLDNGFFRVLDCEFRTYLRDSGSDIPIVAISTHPSVKAHLEMMAQGIAGHLIQPLTVEEIRAEVERAGRAVGQAHRHSQPRRAGLARRPRTQSRAGSRRGAMRTASRWASAGSST